MDIAIIGTGLMGSAFVQRFVDCGYSVSVFNRTQAKLEGLAEDGVKVCDSVQQLLAQSSTIILMLSNAEAIHQLLPLQQAADLQGKTIIQMATIAPEQSRQISQAVEQCGGLYLEAPVLGSIPEAIAGTLIIMAGGDQAVYEQVAETLSILGDKLRYIGDIGTASALKLSMNQLIAALTAGFSLSLGYALKNGVDIDLFMDTVRESALYAKTYDKKLDKYLQRDFATANFSTRHLLKDIALFIDDANEKGLNTLALQGIEQITRQAVEQGSALMDYSSIYQVIDPE